MIYKETIKTKIKDVEEHNLINNKAILEMLETVATYHSDDVGYGIRDIEKTKLSWVLLDWKLEIKQRPIYGQRLTINTWSKENRKFFVYRDFEVYDENGNLCVIATSKWVLIDMRTGKLTRISQELIDLYKPEEKNVFFEKELDKLEVSPNITQSIQYKVSRRDIDINKHMHNLYYLDLGYEALPEEVYNVRPFNNVRITYKKEIKLGDEVNCNYSYKDGKHQVSIASKDNTIIHAIIELY